MSSQIKSKYSIVPPVSGKFYTRFLSGTYNVATSFSGWRKKIASYALENWMAPGTLLDVGCGTGYLLSMAYNKGFQVSGADPSTGMLEVAKKNYPHLAHSLYFSAATALPFENESFDFVIASGSLVYVREIEEASSEIFRVLKKNGRLRIIDHAKPIEPKLYTPLLTLFSQFSGDVLHDYTHYFGAKFRMIGHKTLGRGGYMQRFDFVKD